MIQKFGTEGLAETGGWKWMAISGVNGRAAVPGSGDEL